MFTTVAFQERRVATALAELLAVPDETHFTSGDDLRIGKYDRIIGLLCLGNAPADAYVISPSLRALSRVYIAPMIYSAPGYVGLYNYMFDDRSRNPIPVEKGEALNAFFEKSAEDATFDDMIVVWLADAPITPVFGDIRTIKANASGTFPPLVWTNSELSFTPDLPSGVYAIVGARAYLDNSQGIVRFNFREQANRPGVICVEQSGCLSTDREFRKGYLGEYGRFETNNPPSIDVLSHYAAGATDVYMRIDVIKVG